MAASFLSLPVELQRCCVNYLDTAALKSTRLTSKALGDIATEALFDVASIHYSEKGSDEFTALIQNDKVRRYIRKLRLDSRPDEGWFYSQCSSLRPPQWWKEAAAGWSCLTPPNLKSLMLNMANACTEGHCAALALALSTFLSSADIDTLEIKNFQDACELQHPHTTQSRHKPKKLHLSITTWGDDASPDMDLELRHRHAFFNNQLDATWLAPMQARLTHLTLFCNTHWGVYPRWQPDLHFPQLKSLALGNWTIAFDWQVDLITSHGPTLDQLILANCPILHASRMTARQSTNAWQKPLPGTGRGRPLTTTFISDLRWHTVLATFKNELVKLRHFSMGRRQTGDGDWGRRTFDSDEAFDDRYGLTPCIDSSRYALFDEGQGPIEWIDHDPERGRNSLNGGHSWTSWFKWEANEEAKKSARFPDCLQEDQDALEDLLKTLRSR